MKRCLAFVLGGGGARGAMQVGALRALLEAGYKPDLLVGTSIGAANAAALALYGVNMEGVDALERAWGVAANSYLMDPRLARVWLRTLMSWVNKGADRQVTEFLGAAGIVADLTFEQITGVRLALIGADLTTGQPVIYGQDPRQSVLRGVLASTAIPPWFPPVEHDGRVVIDGGALSNLAIEPALTMGASEIIALDLNDPENKLGSDSGVNQWTGQLLYSLSKRHAQLELELAEARGVPVHHIELRSQPAVPIWDFTSYRPLVDIGYEIAQRSILQWEEARKPRMFIPVRVREFLSRNAPILIPPSQTA